jgi:hypothetical protein
MSDGLTEWSAGRIFQIDDDARLYIAPAIDDWTILSEYGIDTIFDLEGGLDDGVPTVPDQCLYVYFPIYDEELPNLAKLEGLARLGAALIGQEHRVLSHCGLGFNRSALLAGLILTELGMPGADAVARLRARRPGALFNERFAEFLASIRA